MLDQVTAYLLNSRITDVHHIDSDISLMLGEVKLWVATPWRLEHKGRIVIGNDNLIELLEHEDYRDEYDDAVIMINGLLKESTIVDVQYSNFNELTMKMSSGHIFRSFQTNGNAEDDADNFQLYIPKQRYIVCSKSVELEDLHQFYKE